MLLVYLECKSAIYTCTLYLFTNKYVVLVFIELFTN